MMSKRKKDPFASRKGKQEIKNIKKEFDKNWKKEQTESDFGSWLHQDLQWNTAKRKPPYSIGSWLHQDLQWNTAKRKPP